MFAPSHCPRASVWSTRNIVVLPHVGGVHPRRDKLVTALFVRRGFSQPPPLVDRAAARGAVRPADAFHRPLTQITAARGANVIWSSKVDVEPDWSNPGDRNSSRRPRTDQLLIASYHGNGEDHSRMSFDLRYPGKLDGVVGAESTVLFDDFKNAPILHSPRPNGNVGGFKVRAELPPFIDESAAVGRASAVARELHSARGIPRPTTRCAFL